jgi:hypothetical protein
LIEKHIEIRPGNIVSNYVAALAKRTQNGAQRHLTTDTIPIGTDVPNYVVRFMFAK